MKKVGELVGVKFWVAESESGWLGLLKAGLEEVDWVEPLEPGWEVVLEALPVLLKLLGEEELGIVLIGILSVKVGD